MQRPQTPKKTKTNEQSNEQPNKENTQRRANVTRVTQHKPFTLVHVHRRH